MLAQLAKGMHCLDAILAEGHLAREIWESWHDAGHDVGTLRRRRAVQACEHCLPESG